MLHSCPGSYAGDYGGEIAAFWNETARDIEDGSRVLDLACGNGAVTRLLVQAAAPRHIEVDAVDRAVLQPTWPLGLGDNGAQRIRFHSSTPAEALPFEAGCFGLVVSQYGLEYTDLSRSVPELLRVARRPSRVALITHHSDSRPVQLAGEEIAHLRWLLQPDGFLEVSRAMLDPLTQALSPQGRASLARSPSANSLRTNFNALQQVITTRIATSACPDVLDSARSEVGRVFQALPTIGKRAADDLLKSLEIALEDHAHRLGDVIACSLNAERLQQLIAAIGGEAHVDTVREQDILMGWTVRIGLR